MRSFWLMAFCAGLSSASAPVKVWVELRDKGPTRATGREWEDAPVYAPYLNQLHQIGFKLDVALKWQNRVSGWIDSARITGLNRLPAVRRVEVMLHDKAPSLRKPQAKLGIGLPKTSATLAFGAFQQLFDTTQVSVLRAALPADQGSGQGLRIAIIDQNFPLGDQVFSHLWQDSQIVDQWDFDRSLPLVAHDTLAKNLEDGHGAAVLSLLAGESGAMEGLTPAAKYLLYIAQNPDTEYYNEEDWVAAAIERAVDSGAQVISISLADRFDYNYPPDSSNTPYDVPYSDMNGRTRPSSLAALGAARRGVLVSVAMGNEGPVRDNGPTISAPADADSILSVGILDLNLRPCSYTSTGPTFDGRVKPEVSSIGPNSCATPTANPTASTGVIYQYGTSFAAPVVAGIAALLRQLHPTAPAQIIRQALMATAANTLHPDSAAGYGLVRPADAHRILSVNYPGQGAFVWDRSSPRIYMRWRPGLDFSAARLWDMRGRSLSVQSGSTGPVFWIAPGSKGAAGFYVFKVPLRTDSLSAW